MKKNDYTKILQDVAKSNGVTLEEVKAGIQEAYKAAKNSDDFYTQELWKNCVSQNGEPTPEEILEFVTSLVIECRI